MLTVKRETDIPALPKSRYVTHIFIYIHQLTLCHPKSAELKSIYRDGPWLAKIIKVADFKAKSDKGKSPLCKHCLSFVSSLLDRGKLQLETVMYRKVCKYINKRFIYSDSAIYMDSPCIYNAKKSWSNH